MRVYFNLACAQGPILVFEDAELNIVRQEGVKRFKLEYIFGKTDLVWPFLTLLAA